MCVFVCVLLFFVVCEVTSYKRRCFSRFELFFLITLCTFGLYCAVAVLGYERLSCFLFSKKKKSTHVKSEEGFTRG
jgi:hypothetical protein